MSELIHAGLTDWEIGPYHNFLPGPVRLKLKIDGEVIVSADAETGYLHRGLEKAFELHLWQAAIAYADHLDPEAAVFAELALCMAVEDISFLTAPPRAQAIRVILCELTRISSHLGYSARMAKSVGADTVVHYLLRDREKVLDLFELLTGQRFSVNFLRFGGVRADVTEGFIERVFELCEMLRARLKEYNDIFSFNHTFKLRTQGVGGISPLLVQALGLTGPNARASGAIFDARKQHPYCGYDLMDFTVPVARVDEQSFGDAHARFLLRLREISQSVELLKQATEMTPSGDFHRGPVDKNFAPPQGEAYARVESSRGLLGCHVVSNGGRSPARVHFRTPSLAPLSAISRLLEGVSIEDLPVVLASLDLGIAEADR
jgi:NADH-quinone oxidoreductase subunit D